MLYQLKGTSESELEVDEAIKTKEIGDVVLQQLEQQVREHHLSYNDLHGTSGFGPNKWYGNSCID